MAQVIERIIRHHSLSLISAYQLYHSPYKGLWSDSHKLFLLAVKKTAQKKMIHYHWMRTANLIPSGTTYNNSILRQDS